MSETIIGLVDWLQTPPGRYLMEWERTRLDAAVADIFGYHALQLGLPQLDSLVANRMPHQWLALDQAGALHTEPLRPAALLSDFRALPFPSSSLDLVVLPHTLEFSKDPHATLREVERVLVPEGRVVLCGMNPTSLWGFRQRRGHVLQRLGMGSLFLPDAADGASAIPHRTLRSANWLQRFAWMDQAGARWWPILGAAYFVVAVKRVRGMRMLGPAWKAKPARAVGSVTVAHTLPHGSERERSN